MINFCAPDYIWHHKLIMYIARLQKDCPEIFQTNRCLKSSYGLPGNFIWGGGRNIPPWDFCDCVKLVKEQQEIGLQIKHVCTNGMLEEQHLTDTICNKWLKELEREGDAVVVNSPLLKDYIEDKYPKYNIIYSATKNFNTIQEHNNAHEEGYDTVLYYCHNHNEEILSGIKHPEKVEIICAEACIEFCPNRVQHYREIDKILLGITTDANQIMECPYNKESLNFYHGLKAYPNSSVSNEWVDYLYNTYGYQTFKIAGRDLPSYPTMEILLYYLIKPEYRDAIRMQLWGELEYSPNERYRM